MPKESENFLARIGALPNLAGLEDLLWRWCPLPRGSLQLVLPPQAERGPLGPHPRQAAKARRHPPSTQVRLSQKGTPWGRWPHLVHNELKPQSHMVGGGQLPSSAALPQGPRRAAR